MFSFFFSRSLKNKLILYFLIIAIAPAAIISYFYFKSSQQTLEKDMIKTSMDNLAYSMDIIDKQLENSAQISDWLFFNRNLNSILTKKYPSHTYKYDAEIRTFLDLMDFQLRYNASIGPYVYSLLVVGKNGVDLRTGSSDSALINKNEIERSDWFKKTITQRGLRIWYGIIVNPASIKYETYILPLVRPIIHSITSREIGWQMIGFRTSLIADLFRNFKIRPDETVMVIDSRGYCIYHNVPYLIGRDLKEKYPYLKTIMRLNTAGYLFTKIKGTSRIAVFSKSQLTGWSIVKVLSAAELEQQKRLLLIITTLILFSSFIFTALLTVFLSNHLTHPLTKIMQQMKAISGGNFDKDPSIEGQDELGTLGRGINEMAVNLKSLMNQVVEDEQEKRRLELEVLQHQVNPHFLYNTLNSVKLMATIQKADAIKEMVTALGRLIMHLSQNKAEKITIAEEISLLNDYVYIQNIRYKGKIKINYRLENEDCLKYKIVKFTLQPIIENAIFHGIEPKKDAGKITVSISEENGRILICIEDDGVGMTPEQIEAVLTALPAGKTRGLSGIGVKNVDERIKLIYGPEYGLAIESKAGQYTRVYLKIPCEI